MYFTLMFPFPTALEELPINLWKFLVDNKSSLLLIKSIITQIYQQYYLIYLVNDSKQNRFDEYNSNIFFLI